MLKHVLAQMAAYNRWANARLYAVALELPDEAYRRDVGVFFRSLHGTFNHLLVTDRIWLKRLTGQGVALKELDAIVCDGLVELCDARVVEDERIVALVDRLGDAELVKPYEDRVSGKQSKRTLAELLSHLFNHQTHHRGQAHACCSILGVEAPSLDLLQFQAGKPAPDLRTLSKSRR